MLNKIIRKTYLSHKFIIKNMLTNDKNIRYISNPLLRPYSNVPFTEIQPNHYFNAIETLLEESKEEIEKIVNNNEIPTFNNSVKSFEFSNYRLDQAVNLLNNINRSDVTEELQQIYKKVSPLLISYKNEVNMNKKLFERINTLYKHKDKLNLAVEENSLLEKKFKNFLSNGALLKTEEAKRLSEINIDLAKLILTFEENLLSEKKDYIFNIINEEDVKGLPESYKEAANKLAKSLNIEGWTFTFDVPSYSPFITYVEHRKLREKFSIEYGARCFMGNKNDNQEIVIEIAKLRKEKANLLGFKSHADYIFTERMESNPNTIEKFLNDILEKTLPLAKLEYHDLCDFAFKLDGIEKLEKWDISYYSEKLKKKLFDLDEELIRPYFKLDNVIQGAFEVANKLYNITFTENLTIDRYNSVK